MAIHLLQHSGSDKCYEKKATTTYNAKQQTFQSIPPFPMQKGTWYKSQVPNPLLFHGALFHIIL